MQPKNVVKVTQVFLQCMPCMAQAIDNHITIVPMCMFDVPIKIQIIPWYRKRIPYLLVHFNISLLMQIQFQGPDKDENPYEPKPNNFIPLSVFAILCCTGFPAFLCAITAMIYSCQVLQLVWRLLWHGHCNSCENSSSFLRLCLHNNIDILCHGITKCHKIFTSSSIDNNVNERHWSAKPSAQQCMWFYLCVN